MKKALRHSHIAVRDTLARLADRARAQIIADEDDFGLYHFFDLTVETGPQSQCVRFACHPGDAMVHVLAERIDDLASLALALRQAGLDGDADFSISRDQEGKPLRNLAALRAALVALSRSKSSMNDTSAAMR